MATITNEEIIKRYLNHYEHSKQSSKTRASCLNYFFLTKYNGYNGHIFNIKKEDLVSYFDYLNQLETISLDTKKLKWNIIKSFLKFSMEFYDNFQVTIPKFSIKWQPIHKQPKTNKDVVMTLEELSTILNYFKENRFTYYLIFRILAETGMRKGGVINYNIEDSEKNLNNRTIITKEKTGVKQYFVSKELSEYLSMYLEDRKLEAVNINAFFISRNKDRFSNRAFNGILKGVNSNIGVLRKLNINKNITCHTFRRSLNTFRFKMGAPSDDMEFLLGHSISLNRDKYVKLSHEEKLEIYDKWYPYYNVSI